MKAVFEAFAVKIIFKYSKKKGNSSFCLEEVVYNVKDILILPEHFETWVESAE